MRGQETAFQLISTIDRGEIISRFLRRYAREHQRPGRIEDAARFRELLQTIRREVLLLMALEIESEAKKRLAVPVRAKTPPGEFDLPQLFRDEFYFALGRGLDHAPEDASEFSRDLDVYRALRENAGGRKSPAKIPSPPKGPFVDRCGFILDSPMLDQARRAAAQFESEVTAMASAVLRRVFSRRDRL